MSIENKKPVFGYDFDGLNKNFEESANYRNSLGEEFIESFNLKDPANGNSLLWHGSPEFFTLPWGLLNGEEKRVYSELIKKKQISSKIQLLETLTISIEGGEVKNGQITIIRERSVIGQGDLEKIKPLTPEVANIANKRLTDIVSIDEPRYFAIMQIIQNTLDNFPNEVYHANKCEDYFDDLKSKLVKEADFRRATTLDTNVYGKKQLIFDYDKVKQSFVIRPGQAANILGDTDVTRALNKYDEIKNLINIDLEIFKGISQVKSSK